MRDPDTLETFLAQSSEEESSSAAVHFPVPALDRAQFARLLGFRYQPSHYFRLILLRGIEIFESAGEPFALALKVTLDNLADEDGIVQQQESNYSTGPNHGIARRATEAAVNIPPHLRGSALSETLEDFSGCIQPVRTFLQFGLLLMSFSPLAALVFLLYWEGRIHRVDYPILLHHMDTLFGFPKVEEGDEPAVTATEAEIPPRWHLQSHAEHDVYHEQQLWEALRAAATASDRTLVKVVWIATQAAWDTMDRDIVAEVFAVASV